LFSSSAVLRRRSVGVAAPPSVGGEPPTSGKLDTALWTSDEDGPTGTTQEGKVEMDDGVSETLIKQVVASTVGSCGACAEPLDERAVSVVGHQEDLWFFSLVCDQCQTRVLVAALVREDAPVAAGDAPTPQRPSRVEGEDVLAVREFLDHFDGDFQALFG
jgi:hypothetical protein